MAGWWAWYVNRARANSELFLRRRWVRVCYYICVCMFPLLGIANTISGILAFHEGLVLKGWENLLTGMMFLCLSVVFWIQLRMGREEILNSSSRFEAWLILGLVISGFGITSAIVSLVLIHLR